MVAIPHTIQRCSHFMGEMRPTVDRVETGVELALMAVVAAVIAAVMMAHRSNPGEFHRWDLHWHRRLHHHLSLLPRLLLFLLLDLSLIHISEPTRLV